MYPGLTFSAQINGTVNQTTPTVTVQSLTVTTYVSQNGGQEVSVDSMAKQIPMSATLASTCQTDLGLQYDVVQSASLGNYRAQLVYQGTVNGKAASISCTNMLFSITDSSMRRMKYEEYLKRAHKGHHHNNRNE